MSTASVHKSFRDVVVAHDIARRAVSLAAGADSLDLSALGRFVGESRVVMLGEPWHGDGGSIAFRARIVRYLHEQKKFDVLVFEADFYALHEAWRDALRKGDVREAMEQICAFWTTTEVGKPRAGHRCLRSGPGRPRPGLPTAETSQYRSIPRRSTSVRDPGGQHLNFDFVLRNGTGDTLIINKVEVSVLDEAGKIARREFYDEYDRKSLKLEPSRVLRNGRTAVLYNPFHTFAADVPLNRLQYEFSFRTKDRSRELKAHAVVSPVAYEQKTNLILPVRGRVLVWDGYDYNAHHRRRDYTRSIKQGYGSNPGRYSYEFVIVDERGQLYKGRPRSNDDWYGARPDNWDDYYSFGVPIYATSAGRVVLVKDTRPDDRTFDQREFKEDENSPAGNYIVIDHLDGEVSAFGHLMRGSARVKSDRWSSRASRSPPWVHRALAAPATAGAAVAAWLTEGCICATAEVAASSERHNAPT